MNTLATYKLLHKLILILFLGAFTASCTSLQPGLPSEDASGVAARQLSAQGDHTAASRTYLDLAVSSAGEQRQRYLIFSASELYLANDLDGADRILAEAGETIAPANLELWAQVTAELNLALGNPEKALLALNQVTSSVSQVTASHILLLRSDALFKLSTNFGSSANHIGHLKNSSNCNC